MPRKLEETAKKNSNDFTRNCKLPLPKLITFILSIVASGKGKGVDCKSTEFFRNAKRSGLWPSASAVHRSSVTKARKKLDWNIFQDIFLKAVVLAYELWPKNDPNSLWHGMSVFAVDGSKYDLPATKEIREEFDPKSGLMHKGRGHFPQCLVSTVYDVFRRIPIARSIAPMGSSEREEFKGLLPQIPAHSLLLFDRGYPSYNLISLLLEEFIGFFIFRCPATSTFPAVEAFVKSGKAEQIIQIIPGDMVIRKTPCEQRKKLKALKIRAIRLVSPEGVVSVLLTNLYNPQKFCTKDIIWLYFRRWEIEGYYRDEKSTFEIETFHCKTPNGIRQELFAVMIMAVITRTMMSLSSDSSKERDGQPQFKNAMCVMASEAVVLVPDDPDKAVEIFNNILKEIALKRFYKSKKPRPPAPRVNKKPSNKWADSRKNKVKKA
ncbi:MAG: IS4 family transposase [Desulfobacteraceae bacterium]